MTTEEKLAYQRETAALIVAAIMTGWRPPKFEHPEPEPGADEATMKLHAERRHAYEQERNLERADLAMVAFAQAGAMLAEAELYEGPQDEEGNVLDERAFGRQCIHGQRMDEPCDACDSLEAAKMAAATLPSLKELQAAEAAKGENAGGDEPAG